jgi:RTX calcium-binding nonapeptide repeat (4 copies)/WD40-like Beta Propeller Repeat
LQFANASLSPDGRRIVFEAGTRVLSVNRDGSELATLVGDSSGGVAPPSWVPNTPLVLVRAADGGPMVVRDPFRRPAVGTELRLGQAAWSPDSTRLAAFSSGRWALWRLDAAVPTLVKVRDLRLPAAATSHGASWAPEGSAVALDARRAGCRTGSIVVSTARLSAPRFVTSDCLIVGSARGDRIQGSDLWADLIRAGGGRDVVRGGWGNDTIEGGAGNDVLWGDQRGDLLDGGSGNDRLFGGVCDDTLLGGSGRDALYGGEGTDRIRARDGERDVVNCGETPNADDTAIVDRVDSVRNCTQVLRGS